MTQAEQRSFDLSSMEAEENDKKQERKKIPPQTLRIRPAAGWRHLLLAYRRRRLRREGGDIPTRNMLVELNQLKQAC